MAYRIVELTKPTECHVNNHQLIVEQEDGTVQIPVEDIEIILCIGAKIRFSTMGLGELNQAGIVIVAFGKKHEPETKQQKQFSITPLQNWSPICLDLPFSEGDTPLRGAVILLRLINPRK